MTSLRPLQSDAVAAALDLARKYRAQSEPLQAESVCLDVLEADPGNQEAIQVLLLALTDQFTHSSPPDLGRVRALIPQIEGEYQRLFYSGLVAERRATSLVTNPQIRGSGFLAYDLLQSAMAFYSQAQEVAEAGNPEAALRLNACVRILERNPRIQPDPNEHAEHPIE